MRRGFTLLELCFVISIMGILTALTVPTYDVLLRRAHQSEARSMLSAIAHAQLTHQRDTGTWLACPATGPIPAPTAAFPDEACWKTLGIFPDGPVRYRYGVTLRGEGFIVTAEGDLDRDGQASLLTLEGSSLTITAVDGLE